MSEAVPEHSKSDRKDGFAGSAIVMALLSPILLFHTRSKNGQKRTLRVYGSNEAALVRPYGVFLRSLNSPAQLRQRK